MELQALESVDLKYWKLESLHISSGCGEVIMDWGVLIRIVDPTRRADFRHKRLLVAKSTKDCQKQ